MSANGLSAQAAQDLDQRRKQYTDSDYLVDGSGKTIRNYRTQLYTSGVEVNFGKKTLKVTTDDPIIHIIPEEEFAVIGFRTFVGKEYGYVMETWKDHYTPSIIRSTVMVIDITSYWSAKAAYNFSISP